VNYHSFGKCIHVFASIALAVAAWPARVNSAELDYPLAGAVGAEDRLYLADRNLPGIWQVDGERGTVFFAASKQLRTPLNAVRCVAIDHQGKLLAGDSATREVYRFDDDKKPVPLTNGGIGIPMGIGVRPSGELLVADLELHRIWKVPSAGGAPELFAEVPSPRAIFVDSNDVAWMVSHGKNQLLKLDQDGKIEAAVSGRPFEFPSAVVVNAEGVAFVCDTYGKAIWRVEPGRDPVKWVSGAPMQSPVGLALRGDDLLVIDPRAKTVFAIDPKAELTKLDIKVE
jgi:sugar lactone lactonase YvrE